MKENNTDSQNQSVENNIHKNNIIENSQISSNIVANTSNNNNINIINDINNNDLPQINEIIINNNEDNNNNNNINQIITNENLEEFNNNIVNDSINLDDEEIVEEEFKPVFTFSFKLFFSLNSLAYYYGQYKSNKIKNFTLCFWPIYNKKQFYRILTSHFCYQGFLDFFLSMLGFFYITKYLERQIGSIYLIITIFHGMIFVSILYLLTVRALKFLFNTFIFSEQGSFSGIDFCLFLSYFLLRKNKSRNVNFISFDVKGIYLVYFIIFLIQFLSPSALFIFNICGTLSAFLIFKFHKNSTLPRINWIIDSEKLFGLDNNKNIIKNILGYYSLKDNENIIDNIKEFENV